MSEDPYTRMIRNLDSIEKNLDRIYLQLRVLYGVCGILIGALVSEWLR